MNKVILMGRLTSDPKMDWTRSEDSKQYATYTLAVNRRFKKNGQADADFISCKADGAGGAGGVLSHRRNTGR